MIQGSLKTMPLSDLVQWLAAAHKTGTLVVEGPNYTTRVIFRDGTIISSSSTDPRSYFGQFLLAYTQLTEEDLRRAFALQEKSRVRLRRNIYIKTLLGKILSDEGLLRESEIMRVLRIKSEETILNAFLWPDGSFRFLPDELPPEELIPIALEVQLVVNKGIQRSEEWRQIRAIIPSARATFRVQPERIPADLVLSALESRILLLLGQGKPIDEIMLELHLTEFAADRTVYDFFKQGFVELTNVLNESGSWLNAQAAYGSVENLIASGQKSYDIGQYEATIVATRQALREDPGADEARKLLEKSEREFSESFYTKLFDRGDVPHLNGSRDSLHGEFSAEEKFLLARINGVWDIDSLVKISPLKEVDTLAILKRLVDRNLVSMAHPGS